MFEKWCSSKHVFFLMVCVSRVVEYCAKSPGWKNEFILKYGLGPPTWQNPLSSTHTQKNEIPAKCVGILILILTILAIPTHKIPTSTFSGGAATATSAGFSGTWRGNKNLGPWMWKGHRGVRPRLKSNTEVNKKHDNQPHKMGIHISALQHCDKSSPRDLSTRSPWKNHRLVGYRLW